MGWCILAHALYNTASGVFTPIRDPVADRLVSVTVMAAALAFFLAFRGRIRPRPGNAPA